MFEITLTIVYNKLSEAPSRKILVNVTETQNILLFSAAKNSAFLRTSQTFQHSLDILEPPPPPASKKSNTV